MTNNEKEKTITLKNLFEVVTNDEESIKRAFEMSLESKNEEGYDYLVDSVAEIIIESRIEDVDFKPIEDIKELLTYDEWDKISMLICPSISTRIVKESVVHRIVKLYIDAGFNYDEYFDYIDVERENHVSNFWNKNIQVKHGDTPDTTTILNF